MKSMQSGFILFSLLIAIQIISFVALAQLSLVKDAAFSAHLAARSLVWQINIESLIKQESVKIVTRKRCEHKIIMPASLLTLPKNWWRTNACSSNFNRIRYYYLFENLGMDSCARTLEQDVGVAYRRISLLLPTFDQHSYSVWQATLALKTKSIKPCQGSTHPIKPGLQMLRQLI